MSPRSEEGPGTEGRPDYGTVARVFHWTIVAMVFTQIPLGIAMTSEALPRVGDQMFILHKGLGLLVLVVICARLVWRATHRVPALPSGAPGALRQLATVTHWALYGLLVLLPISGYLRTVGDGFPIEVLDALGIPPLVSDIPETAHLMLVVHKAGAYVLAALIAAHVGAVVDHAWLRGEGVISRMWPPIRRRQRPRPMG